MAVAQKHPSIAIKVMTMISFIVVMTLSCSVVKGYDASTSHNNAADHTSAYNVERRLIVGGKTTRKGAGLFITGLRATAGGNNFCAGSLITPTHVLSASHCVSYGIRWVSIGSHYLNGTEDGEQIQVISVQRHPKYKSDGYEASNDFVVLTLQRPSKITPIALAAANGSNAKSGDWAAAFGWGKTRQHGAFSYHLKHVWLQLLSKRTCFKLLKSDSEKSTICAGGLGTSACFADSGGPLVRKVAGKGYTLIGLVSWGGGDSCGDDGTPTAFAAVAHVRSWIDGIVGHAGYK